MTTEELIAAMAADRRRHRPPRWGPVVMAALVSAALFGLFWSPRPDLATALAGALLVKTAFPLALAATALALAFRLARPAAWAPVRPALALAGLAALGLLAGAITLQPTAVRAEAWSEARLALCLVSIPALGALPMATAFHQLRRGASSDPARTGLCAGLAAGGIGAMLYSLACSDDSPLFFVPAYGAAIIGMGELGQILGRRCLGI